MFLALVVIALVVVGSLAFAAVYVGLKDRHPRARANDVKRADDAQASAEPQSLGPSDRAGNAASKYV